MNLLVAVIFGALGLGATIGQGDRVASCSFPWQPYFTTHHDPDLDAGLGEQVWAIRQLGDGTIVAATTSGVSTFDGYKWIPVVGTAEKPFFSLGVGGDGLLYYGGYKDFGVIQRGNDGRMLVRSLVEATNVDLKSFSRVWSTVSFSGGILFQSPERLFVLAGQRLAEVESSGPIHNAFGVAGRAYVRVVGAGLHELREDRLVLVPGGEAFASERIFLMGQGLDGRLIVGSSEGGLYTSDGSGFRKVSTALDHVAKGARRYQGAFLEDGRIAVATLGGGLVLLDSDGSLLATVNSGTYLKDDMVNVAYGDNQHGVWVGYNAAGISRLDICAPVAKVDWDSGFKGGVRSITEVDDRLYVATGSSDTGLLVIDRRTGRMETVEQVLPWDVAVCDRWVLVAAEEGLTLYDDSHRAGLLAQKLTDYKAIAKPRVIRRNTARSGCSFIVGGASGVWRVDVANRGNLSSRLVQQGSDIDDILVQSDGTIWYAERGSGLRRIHPESGDSAVAVPGKYRTDAKLRLFALGARVGVLPHRSEDLYVFEPASDSMRVASEFSGQEGLGWIHAVAVSPGGALWKVYKNLVEVWRPYLSSEYRLEVPGALRIPIRWSSHILVDSDEVAWLDAGKDFLRYDPRANKNYESEFFTVFRSVSVGASADTVQVVMTDDLTHVLAGSRDLLQIPYSKNSIEATFMSISFEHPELAQYRYRLVGLDSSWTGWSSVKSRRFADLPPGDYVLEAQARSVHGQEGVIGRLPFVVRPAWYHSLLLRSLVVVLGILLVLAGTHYRRLYLTHRLAEQQAIELARERQLSQKLQEANEQLSKAVRMKDEFLATTSHELRTPITAMLGAAEILRSEMPPETDHQEFVSIIQESGKRLMGTLASILDISQLRAGNIQLLLEPVDVASVVKDISERFRVAADRKGLQLSIDIGSSHQIALADRSAVERMVAHLVDNAVKFTERGSVHVRVRSSDTGPVVSVRDTGEGIDEEFLPYIFDEFGQESQGEARAYSGTGLGLAIVAGLAKLSKASIDVSSRKGVGSEFEVAFPRFADTEGASSHQGTVEAASKEPTVDREPLRRSERARTSASPRGKMA